MRKWILIGGAAFVGVVLAFILIPKPNTGGEIAPVTRVKPGEVPIVTARPGAIPLPTASAVPDGITGRITRVGGAAPADAVPRVGVKVPDARVAEGLEKRNRPDALTAGRASAPWSLVRREILRNDDDFSKEVMADAAEIIAELRVLRRDPDSTDFVTLEKRQVELASKIRASELMNQHEEIPAALDRLDEILAEYHAQVEQTP